MDALTYSQNGWPVNPPRSSRTIPGTGVNVTVTNGPAGDVLMYVLSQFDKRVEDIDLKSTRGEFDDWGYANRNVRGSTAISNHASATAVDVNATRHPLGAVGTFTTRQVTEIHKILSEVSNVVRWGGDYVGRKDEMHFEIVADFNKVKQVADRLRRKPMSVLDEKFTADYDSNPYRVRSGTLGHFLLNLNQDLDKIRENVGAAPNADLAERLDKVEDLLRDVVTVLNTIGEKLT